MHTGNEAGIHFTSLHTAKLGWVKAIQKGVRITYMYACE